MLASIDDDIPVVVSMRVECARCGHAEDNGQIRNTEAQYARFALCLVATQSGGRVMC